VAADEVMTDPLVWKQSGNSYRATDGTLRYRITMGMGGKYTIKVDGVSIGDKYATVRAAVEYVEHGGEPPRRSKDT
jgi:hypothetical protein